MPVEEKGMSVAASLTAISEILRLARIVVEGFALLLVAAQVFPQPGEELTPDDVVWGTWDEAVGKAVADVQRSSNALEQSIEAVRKRVSV